MATTDGLMQAPFKLDDIDDAMTLVEEAGWNQVAADWRLMCDGGDAVIIRNENERIAATALALPYPGGFGWISMVLVSTAMRRQGLATALLGDRIDWLQERGLVPILDATEAGEQVYTKIGFVPGLRFTRWQGERQNSYRKNEGVREANTSDEGWISTLDAEVFNADRRNLIGDFLNRDGSKCFVIETKKPGFIISRQGRRAAQFGPLISASEDDAIALVDAALAVTDGPVFFDLLDTRTELAAYISSIGFEKQRGFTRMSLGDSPDFDGGGRTMIIAGPEYG
ncbi:GNAT family N-acetyltransferase [Sneathiella sp.]|uniref:GNAT family N-acetyltransferase n=1 Tax=Sneathiella sp. TaxID=1964365 RepID=UPI003561C715